MPSSLLSRASQTEGTGRPQDKTTVYQVAGGPEAVYIRINQKYRLIRYPNQEAGYYIGNNRRQDIKYER